MRMLHRCCWLTIAWVALSRPTLQRATNQALTLPSPFHPPFGPSFGPLERQANAAALISTGLLYREYIREEIVILAHYSLLELR